MQKLDDGETESLAFCVEQGEPDRVCSSDAMVFKVLALMDRSEQGIALEEVLDGIGLSRQLGHQYTKAFRELNKARGFEDRMARMGLKRQA